MANRKTPHGKAPTNKMAAAEVSGFDAAQFAAALRHHQAGQLAEAEGLYRRILEANPRHVDSLHMLGVLAHQVGRNDIAVDLIGQAISQNDRLPECHFNIGLAFGALGRLDEAARHFATAADLRPDYVEAHMNLGNARKLQGRLRDAADCYQRALRINPRSAEAHYNLANVLTELREFDQAEAECRQALALWPNYAEAHNNLGTVLKSQGRVDEEIAEYRAALASNPALAVTHVNLGNALRGQGKPDEAVASYREALRINPGNAEAHNNLGSVFLTQGKLDEARVHCERAVTLKPDMAEGCLNLARVLIIAQYPGDIIGLVTRALEIKETNEAKDLFVYCLKFLQPNASALKFETLVIRALSETWKQPRELARACTRLIKLKPALDACIMRANSAWPRRLPSDELFGPSGLAVAAADPLLRCLLESTPVADVDMERFLTDVRFTMLEAAERAIAADIVEDETLRFYCAIARQCFNNEYIFSYTDAEFERAQRLRGKLLATIGSGAPLPALLLVVVAMYFPLHLLPAAASLLDRTWSDSMSPLLDQQIREPYEERRLRDSIPRLTAIDDDVSLAVKEQYEQNPYPRWVKTAAPVGASNGDDGPQNDRPQIFFGGGGKGGIKDVLVAGCGTGLQAIEAAKGYVGAHVLAVDLSLTSLSYAQRQTRALGVQNIEYAQADILKLGSIGRTFDVILASGVLHHLADPFAGWRVLLSLLRPGAFMFVGLYSELARRDITAAQKFLRERNYLPTSESIRRCRHDLLDTPLRSVARAGDFFSTSECRDLLFHVQESRITIPAIKAFIAEQGLTFIGFEFERTLQQKFHALFADANWSMSDLDIWHNFETENPDTFAAMYNFWIQKGT